MRKTRTESPIMPTQSPSILGLSDCGPCCPKAPFVHAMSYQQWLQHVCQPYAFASRVFYDVDQVLKAFPGLRPRTDNCTLPSGQIALLICIAGFIPVMSAQNDFRPIDVPLEIWLPHRYPHEPPLFFVRLNLLPPQNPPIIIRATSISDVRGVISYPGTFNTLIDAIKELQNEFCAELPIVSAPPVYNVVVAAPPTATQQFTPQPQIQHFPNQLTSQQSPATSTKRADDIKAQFLAKVQKRLNEGRNDSSSVKDSAQETNYRLLQNRKDREREKMALGNEVSLIAKELENLQHRQQNLEDWIAQSENFDSIDKILLPKDQRTAQLSELLALEAALNDAVLGVMKKILSAEPGLPIASGLRVIRDLSRRHFLTKYHIKKIVSK